MSYGFDGQELVHLSATRLLHLSHGGMAEVPYKDSGQNLYMDTRFVAAGSVYHPQMVDQFMAYANIVVRAHREFKGMVRRPMIMPFVYRLLGVTSTLTMKDNEDGKDF